MDSIRLSVAQIVQIANLHAGSRSVQDTDEMIELTDRGLNFVNVRFRVSPRGGEKWTHYQSAQVSTGGWVGKSRKTKL